MRVNQLGRTGLQVSELCFGTLPMGPTQCNKPIEEGADVLLAAMQNGVNFFDTAQMYRTYPYLERAMQTYGKDVIISSKSMTAGYQEMQLAIEEAMRALKRDWIDIFLLHAARVNTDVFEQRAGALQCLIDYRQKGYLRAIGISTHDVGITSLAADIAEIDVVFPLYNKTGVGIMSGTPADMLAAVNTCAAAGKGLFSMKLLGGGTLIDDLMGCLDFGRREQAFSAHALGMISRAELEINLKIFNNQQVTEQELDSVRRKKYFHVAPHLCKQCGNCVETCPNMAITLIDGAPQVVEEKCLKCGYCAAACPAFAIRVS